LVGQSALAVSIGLLLLLTPFIRLLNHYFSHYHLRLDNYFSLNSGVVSTILGLMIIYTSFFLLRQKRVAYRASISLAILSLLSTLALHRASYIAPILLVIFIVWMLRSRQLYTVRSDTVSMIAGTRISLLIATLGFTYGTLSFLLLGPRFFHYHFTVQDAAVASIKTLFTLNDAVATTSRLGTLLTDSLATIGLAIYVLIFSSLFKPVRFAISADIGSRKRAEAILREHSTSAEDYFKLWPRDKHYFFSSSGQSFLAYKLRGRTAFILGDLSGIPSEIEALLADFLRFIHHNDWSMAAINATSLSENLYTDMNALFIGNEAVIDTQKYAEQTVHSKHFRYVLNKATKEGLSVEMWSSVTTAQVNLLRKVSDDWLGRGGRKEYTFFMGYFNEEYLKSCQIMILRQNEHIIGYANLIPTFVEGEASIDHFRSINDSPPISMHYLLSQLVLQLHEQHIGRLNIGLSPLSENKQSDDTKLSLNDRLLGLFKRFGGRYYSFAGVEQFKNKFQPEWLPRYLYYEHSQAALLSVTRDLEMASRASTALSGRIKVIIGIVGVLAFFVSIQFL
jgi:phosphatidylglycerol lysyltransferase